MEERGIIQHNNNPYASSVVLLGKKDGSSRLCVDYRKLNQQIVKNKFPKPVIEELIDELSRASVFSKIDLKAGYHRLKMVA